MRTHFMVDIETLCTLPTATILTIGAIGFNPITGQLNDKKYYYERITLESQEGRTINDDTIAWWSSQTQEVQDEAFGEEGRLDVKEALLKLSKLLFHGSGFWSQGSFDFVILSNAFKQYGISIPWDFWQTNDTRTIFKLVKDLPKLGNSHNAMEDCINQVELLAVALDKLGVKDL